MLRAKYGSSRIVFLVGRYAFKFPKLPKWGLVKSFLKGKSSWALLSFFFKKGLAQNRNEWKSWRVCKAPFLAPTLLSFGLMNVQKRIDGEEVSVKEGGELIGKMAKATGNNVYTIEPHSFFPDNFLRGKRGYIFVDYGDADFGTFVVHWQKELTEALVL